MLRSYLIYHFITDICIVSFIMIIDDIIRGALLIVDVKLPGSARNWIRMIHLVLWKVP